MELPEDGFATWNVTGLKQLPREWFAGWAERRESKSRLCPLHPPPFITRDLGEGYSPSLPGVQPPGASPLRTGQAPHGPDDFVQECQTVPHATPTCLCHLSAFPPRVSWEACAAVNPSRGTALRPGACPRAPWVAFPILGETVDSPSLVPSEGQYSDEFCLVPRRSPE